MDQGPLVIQQIDAGERFLNEFHKTLPVTAACWVKEVDNESWYLYVASEKIDHGNVRDGYLEVIRLANEMSDSFFDPFQVKLIKDDHPIAMATKDFSRRWPGRLPTRCQVGRFGDRYVDDVYVYALPATV